MPEGLRLTPSGVLWALPGAASAFGLTLLVPPLALAINVGLIMGVLVRRRIDAYGWLTIGFAIWCAVYATLLSAWPLDGPAKSAFGARRGRSGACGR